MSAAKATTDHETIREWVEERGGQPAAVRGTGKKSDPGILRIDFPEFSGDDSLEHISWDDFFDAFEKNDLAFLYQETIQGAESRFSKFVRRSSVAMDEEAEEE